MGVCEKGYRGKLCSECDNNLTMAKSGFDCIECDSISKIVFNIIFKALVTLFMVYSSLNSI